MRKEMTRQWRVMPQERAAPPRLPERQQVRGRVALVGSACGTVEAWLVDIGSGRRWSCTMREGEGRTLREGALATVEGRPTHGSFAYGAMRDCVVVPVARTGKAVAA
jgi:hypothetical protein